MFVELHILQNFAPSNLNRDDTGAPKDCEFGGYRRARISSQCLKRAIRACFREQGLLGCGYLSSRTKRLVEELTKRLVALGKPEDQAHRVAQAVVRGIGLRVSNEGLTEYLVFIGEKEIDALTQLCDGHWEQLSALGPATSGRDAKKSGKEALPSDVADALSHVLGGGKAADLGLFGRMLAHLPNKNIDAACQVAHALSTNQVSMEFDFYTAVDDLQPEEQTGAGMMGTVEFNSACFYRYANVDLDQLSRNLDGDEELARNTLTAFLRASVVAVPTGKQNSMAAQNPPSFVLAVVREGGLWSLANAFVRPVRADGQGDLVQNSIRALDRYWGQLTAMYGGGGVAGKWLCTTEDDVLEHLADARVGSVDQLVQKVSETAFQTTGARGA